jgi:hypothetical protein
MTPDLATLRQVATAATPDEIRARVEESRNLRADAGEELVALTGSAHARGAVSVNPSFPALAKCLQHEHEYVRWANATLLSLLSAVEERDALRAKLAAAHAWENARYKGGDGKCSCVTCKDYVRAMETRASLTPTESRHDD